MKDSVAYLFAIVLSKEFKKKREKIYSLPKQKIILIIKVVCCSHGNDATDEKKNQINHETKGWMYAYVNKVLNKCPMGKLQSVAFFRCVLRLNLNAYIYILRVCVCVFCHFVVFSFFLSCSSYSSLTPAWIFFLGGNIFIVWWCWAINFSFLGKMWTFGITCAVCTISSKQAPKFIILLH